MKCPKCGANAEITFIKRGLDIQLDFAQVFISATCCGCRADIALDYECTLCEIDEEV